ncbi:NACHT domain-containing protein [Pseudosulfitobacter koreensis]|uniref:NACHT domain-containing protein n=1 Tax=Pseudosulfitobacter koreensis TaxID=2968472 RepID=A0ABT1Z1E8_9RHOB|nr:hypothetical protein [Pseudosulfitobacter koreense]MCR8826959.1 hypothetical protein [Pseudosulfitobacter koreense]
MDDIPVGIWAESEGPGDDLRLELVDGRVAEVQAKKGLQRGAALWEALDALAAAVSRGRLDFGVLAVAPDSSGTVRENLANDIERIGQGRTDMLSEIGKDWLARLVKDALNPQEVCSSLRIQVVHALAADDADRRLTKVLLATICDNAVEADHGWSLLYEDAVTMMEQRGRADMPRLIRLLTSNGIVLSDNEYGAGIASRLARWVVETRDGFTLSATRKRLPLSALLDMRTVKIPFELPPAESAHKALARYHDGSLGSSRSDLEYDAEWTGRFCRRAVIQAGPGLGKSTLATKLAYEYASDGFPVLLVSLKQVAAAMLRGEGFEAALKAHGLDGSPISVEVFDRARLSDIVVIADGLDDCGVRHEAVAAGIQSYAAGHPRARIIVTTRPIGYTSTQLSQWQHYRLISPSSSSGSYNLGSLLAALSDDSSGADAFELAHKELSGTSNPDAIAVSPLTLGMAASLLHRQNRLPETRPKLYEQLIALFDRDDGIERPEDVSAQIAGYILNVLGWTVVGDPLVARATLMDRCAEALATEMGKTRLATTGIVESALRYWERAGLIESVHHDGVEMLTFVHKTFAEFAAARYIADLDPEARAGELARIIQLPDWTEVTTFASGLGYGNDIARQFMARGTAGHDGQVERALAVAINPDARTDDTVASELAIVAFDAIAVGAKKKFAIGVALMNLAERRPAVIFPLVANRLNAKDFPTRLTAWACITSADMAGLDADRLEAALAELLSNTESHHTTAGRFVFGPMDDFNLLSSVGIAALEVQPPAAMEGFAERYLRHRAFQGTNTQSRIARILGAQGLSFSLLRAMETKEKNLMDRFLNPPEDECRAHNQALRALAVAVALKEDDAQPKPDYPFERFLQFAGYYSLSGFDQAPRRDLGQWSTPYDEPAVQGAMRAMVAISTLDGAMLAAEAREVVRFLDREPTAKPYTLHFPTIDMPSLEWEKASALPMDKGQLETAVRHGSAWLAYVAGNLLESVEITQVDARRILAGARGASLWAGAEIAHAKLPAESATEVLVERLSPPLPRGSEYIFGVLARLTPPMTKELGAAIALGLGDRYISTVTGAAELGLAMVEAGEVIDAVPVARSYTKWQAHEAKQKDKHIQRPSPLETLLKLRIALGELDDDALTAALGDARSDVRKIAEDEREKRAQL